jgi:O-antigen ligase
MILKALSIFVAGLMINRVVWFTPDLGNFYYILIAVSLAILLLLSNKNTSVSFSGIILILVCAVSIVFNDIPVFFRPWLRLGIFGATVFLVGPFINGSIPMKFRMNVFWYVQYLFVAITLLSLIGRFAGLSKFQGGYWCGVTTHSMLLGMIAANTTIFLLYELASRPDVRGKARMALSGSLFISLLLVMGAGSRAAFLACVARISVFCYLAFQQHRKKFIKFFLPALLVLFCTYQIWDPFLDQIRRKNNNDLTTLNLDTREGLWKKNWESFKENPVFGVGFASIELEPGEFQILLGNRGQVETGNSWLSVLSMTGIIGGICIASIMLMTAAQLRRISRAKNHIGALLTGLLAFYCVHMCAEGYIFAGGSVAFFNFWLLLGTILSYDQFEKIKRSEIMKSQPTANHAGSTLA